MGIKKGTKLTEAPKDTTIKFRSDKETTDKLDYLCQTTNRTRSQVIRDGIEQQYAAEKR